MSKVTRRLSKIFELVNLWHFLQAYFPLSAAGVVAMIAAFSNHLPLTYVIVAASVVFAATTGGLLWHHNRTFLRNPEYKLKVISPRVGRDTVEGRELIGFSFELANDALFPIQFRVEMFRTSCSGRSPFNSGQLEKQEFEMQPGEIKTLHDAVIDISGIDDSPMIGRMELSLVYGRSNRLGYRIDQNLDLFVPLDPALQFQWANHMKKTENA